MCRIACVLLCFSSLFINDSCFAEQSFPVQPITSDQIKHAIEEVEDLARSNPNNALELANGIQNNPELNSFPNLKARLLNASSYSLYFLGKYEESMLKAREAENIIKNEKNTAVLARSWMLQANVLQTIGEYSRAISQYKESIEAYKAIGDAEYLGYCYNNIANTYKRAKQYSPALYHYNEYIKIAQLNGYSYASALKGKADVQVATNQIDDAIILYNEAIKQYEEANDPLGVSLAKNGIGDAFLKNNDVIQAIDLYEEVLQLSKRLNLTYVTASAARRKANALLVLGDTKQAEEFIKLAAELDESSGEKDEYASSLRTLSAVYEADGEISKSLKTLKDAIEVQEEFQSKQTSTQLAVMQALFESEAKEAQIADLEEQNRLLNLEREISQKRSENAWLTATLLLGLLGFLALWAMYMQREKSRLARLSKQLAVARHEAEAATEAKSAFLARMSHELRTPINAITGLSRLALETRSTNEQRCHLLNVLDAGEILLRLVDDILDFSRIEAGKLTIDIVPFAPREVVKCALNMQMLQARAKNLQLIEKISPDMPTQLLGDPWRIKQILNNLVSNAVKFTDSGEVTIELTAHQSPDDQNLVLLEGAVRDTGIGLSQDQQDALFQSFSQADDSITRRYGGTGLGLAICKQLCDLMDGRIWIESAPGEGACFRFSLPLAQVNKASMQATVLAKETSIPDWSQYRLLLVEDNEVNRRVALGILQKTKIEVVVAENGQQAISKLQDEFFDAVLMDIQMPVMDGLTAAVIIRQDMELQIPIIAMTAHAMETDRQKSLKAGMNGHLAKPFDNSSLFSILAKHLPTERTIAISEAPTDSLQGWQNEQLADLDVQQSISRLGGNPELYQALLCSFYSDQQDTPTQIRQHLADGQFDVLFRLVHSLKSSSAYIGALGISAKCSTLEPILEHGPCDRKALLVIADELESLLTSLAPMLKKQQIEQHKPLSNSNLADALQQILELLKQSDFTVEDKLATLIKIMKDTPFEDTLTRIAKKVDEVEYERAASLTITLLSELQEQENINTGSVINS
ncbi:response regulator [Bowmanella sp. Y26]|uniref:tetratricopeptide repeat-containing hybrid sensor histidine kinase/response regulator n=1 Tax=Bowmanella yangjiangensis TaxID=2811230 RepID=UPI001BDBE91C|nr:ATP-binding protein [Bowmanella yangjiangensis]MBT1064665.1 response regulator [Bowmanella yangjiangensis]